MSKLTEAARKRLVEVAELCIAHAPLIDYAETRPFHLYTLGQLKEMFAKGQHVTYDCSGFVTELYYAAELSDPNGLGFNGEGYTGTQLTHLKHDSPDSVSRGKPGALAVYGAYPGVHVVMVLEQGKDPIVVSHGSEIGPLKLSLSAESQAHAGQPITMLDVSHLGK